MKAAIIGTGYWGKKLISRFEDKVEIVSYLNLGNTEVEDINRSSWGEILNDKDVTFIIVATPIKNLPRYAIEGLSANKHIWLEKPGASTSKEMKKIAETAKKLNLLCSVNYSILNDSLLNGHIKKASFRWSKYGTFKNDINLNLSSHFIAILTKLFKDISLKGLKKADQSWIEFDNGTIQIDRAVNKDYKKFKQIKINDDKWTDFDDPIKMLDLHIDNFLRAILGKEALISDADFALNVLRNIEKL